MTRYPTAVICLSPYSGGMELDSIKMAEMLTTYTKTIMVAQTDHFISNDFTARESDVILETITFKSSLSPTIISSVRKIIKHYGIKNVIFFGASELKSLYFSFLGLDIDLIIRHGTTKSSPKSDWFHRLIYSNVRYHVAICEHLADNVKKIIPFGKTTQLKVIYSSLNQRPSDSIDFTTRPHDPIKILHVGRIAPGKGQKAAIVACDILSRNGIDFELTLVGGMTEGYQEEFDTFLEGISYHDKIRLAGHNQDMDHFYRQSDIFLFPSDGEGLSNAFNEALAYGLSCISYDNTSFPELARLGFHLSIVPDQDKAALQTALLDAVEHYGDGTSQYKQNSVLAQELFSLSREIDEFLQLLK